MVNKIQKIRRNKRHQKYAVALNLIRILLSAVRARTHSTDIVSCARKMAGPAYFHHHSFYRGILLIKYHPTTNFQFSFHFLHIILFLISSHYLIFIRQQQTPSHKRSFFNRTLNYCTVLPSLPSQAYATVTHVKNNTSGWDC